MRIIRFIDEQGNTRLGEETQEGSARILTGDLYGQLITVELLHRLRSEQKFNGIDELTAQIQQDLVATREWFA